DLPLESGRLQGHPRQPAGDPDCDLCLVCVTPVSAGGDRTTPRTQRVIAAYGDRVVMEETLPGALRALFRETAPPSPAPAAQASTPLAGPAADRAQEALNAYNQAMERLQAGDWGGFGAALDTL